MEPEYPRHCAYNQTSDRLLATDVAAADYSDATLYERMAVLHPQSGTGLWMVPFRGLPETGLQMPVDLLYLDEGCRVIDVVESYPRSRVSPSAKPASSVLALPEQSVALSHTRPGDLLLLCTAEELKAHFRQNSSAAAATHPGSTAAPERERISSNREAPRPFATQPPAREPAKPEKRKSWLQRLLNPDPPEPRRAIRDSIPGLTVYFWTGGTPVPQTVRDISDSGLYVVTEERWYPGTIIRMMLTKRDDSAPGGKQSISIQSRAVRWGNDGVGLEFILPDSQDSHCEEWLASEGATRAQFEQFLREIKSPHDPV